MQEKRTKMQKGGQLLPDIEITVRDILKKWKIIVLVAIASAMFTGMAERLMYQPEYRSSATFTIGKNGWSDSLISENLSVADSLTESLKELAQSDLLKHRVCEELGVTSVDGSITMDAVEASNLMTVTVTADNPRSAWEICNSVLDVVDDLAGSLMQDAAIRVMQEPKIPTTVSNPLRIGMEMKKGGGAAAALVILLSIICSYWKDTIRSGPHLTEGTGAVLLGTLCREHRYKTVRSWLRKLPCSLNITHPGLSFSYVESFRMIAGQIRRCTRQTGEQVLLITSAAEDEGKSTVAANLALSLRQEGATVLLLDLDFARPSQHYFFQLEESAYERFRLIEALQKQEPLRMKRMGASQELPVVFNTSVGHQVLSRNVIRYLRETLKELRKEFDYIVIDTAPLLQVAETEVLADMADGSILVVREDWTETRDVQEAVELLESVRSRMLGCILNRDRRETLSGGKYGYGKYRYGYYGTYSRKEGGTFG